MKNVTAHSVCLTRRFASQFAGGDTMQSAVKRRWSKPATTGWLSNA